MTSASLERPSDQEVSDGQGGGPVVWRCRVGEKLECKGK